MPNPATDALTQSLHEVARDAMRHRSLIRGGLAAMGRLRGWLEGLS
jgi:hypothetical protein